MGCVVFDENILNNMIMNYPAASFGVSKPASNEASFGEYDAGEI